MHHLLLIRHAKSSHKDPSLADHNRNLNKRGERDLLLAEAHFEGNPYQSDLIVSSTAVRAQRLAQTIAKSAHVSLASDSRLYTFSSYDLLHVLQSLPDASSSIAIVGHNPAITDVVNRLSGAQIANVPTSGCVHLQTSIRRWSELQEKCADLISFEYPKKWR